MIEEHANPQRRARRVIRPLGYGPIRSLGKQPDGRYLWEAHPVEGDESYDEAYLEAADAVPPIYRSTTEINLEPLERAARRWRRVCLGAGGGVLVLVVLLVLLATGAITTGHERIHVVREHGEARKLVELTEEWLEDDDVHVYDVTDATDWPARFRQALYEAQHEERSDD